MATSDLSVGEMAARSGVPVSTIHFYEAEGLIESWRTPANHRRYDRRELRRVAIARVALTVGVSLKEVREVLDRVPRGRAVSKADWAAAAAPWTDMLDARIALMQRLRDQMGFCIGCGCLSLDSCPLYNPDDVLGGNGAGPRRWTGDAKERA
ncbi:MAG: redox-sensitive transcriptional activator SoxR [Pseudomonadota bacterium]